MRWKIDALLHNPAVAYVLLTAGLSFGVYIFLRPTVGLLTIVWDLIAPRGFNHINDGGGWAIWPSIGISAVTVWIKGWAQPNKKNDKSN